MRSLRVPIAFTKSITREFQRPAGDNKQSDTRNVLDDERIYERKLSVHVVMDTRVKPYGATPTCTTILTTSWHWA